MARANQKYFTSIVRELSSLTSPLLIWAAHFTIMYGASTLICLGDDDMRSKTITLAVTGAALALLFLNAAYFTRRASGFGKRIAVMLTILSAFAVGASGIASMFMSACTSAR